MQRMTLYEISLSSCRASPALSVSGLIQNPVASKPGGLNKASLRIQARAAHVSRNGKSWGALDAVGVPMLSNAPMAYPAGERPSEAVELDVGVPLLSLACERCVLCK